MIEYHENNEILARTINITFQHVIIDNSTGNDGLTRPLYGTILVAICLCIIILLTIIGNIIVLIALSINFALRSPTHLLMGNLALADLLLGITVLPFSATIEIFEGNWPFGRIFCHIWLAIDVLYCTASINGLMFISIERYIGVTNPLRYHIIITHRRTLIVICSIWILSILISVAPFFGWKKFDEIKLGTKTCFINDEPSYVLFSCSFSFYIPLIIILCVYTRVYREANKQSKFLYGSGHKKLKVDHNEITLRVHIVQSASNGHHNTSTNHLNGKNLITVPSKLSRFKRERKAEALSSVDPGVIFSVCFWLGYCNSCFNPFIYAFSSREFRKAFKSILRCRPHYKKTSSMYRISSAIEGLRLKSVASFDLSTNIPMSASMTTYRASLESQRLFPSPHYDSRRSQAKRLSTDTLSIRSINDRRSSQTRLQKQTN
ncbi:unnamed protein product [Didymodactylos carnosus]|uniref:G-protein coupled receptors family 1 profile domain-containing protein n=1 Tax=Didymodactylos carnosus TaxID=1234261 RepID=A0A813SW98_9BILA|nr:unnamed protein product [Didymodactylos carnosus]CAF3587987.1 unnamed protein product [Didymodactylos carnosus]